MDKIELIKQLRQCGRETDNEKAHIDADQYLLQYLNDEKITEVWNKISRNFWYA